MANFSQDDIQKNKIVGAIAIFPILFVIYFIAGKDSDYVKYCANQGIVFTAVEVILGVVSAVLSMIPLIGKIISLIFSIVGILVLLLIIYQMVMAAKGDAKPIPVVGDIAVIK